MSELERRTEQWRTISSSKEVSSLVDSQDIVDFSVVVVACNYRNDVQRCVESALRWSSGHSIEIIAVDNGSTDGTSEWLEEIVNQDSRIRVLHTDHVTGDAAAKNIGLRQSRGGVVVMLDISTEVTGDLYTPLTQELEDPSVGVVGPFGLQTQDLQEFEEVSVGGNVDAMQAYCFAFKRAHLRYVGWMPETYRFYRNLDIQYSFQFKDLGFTIRADPNLPLRRHTHRVWSEMSEEERDKLSRDNYRRFLHRWHHRTDLLVNASQD